MKTVWRSCHCRKKGRWGHRTNPQCSTCGGKGKIRVEKRPAWDDYWMMFAHAAATRGTCLRLKVGAVIVLDSQLVSSGYNGAAKNQPHCEDVGCDMEDGHCVRTVHAEMNALTQAARRGAKVDGAVIYTTAAPCWNCFRVLLNAGIQRYVFANEYRFTGATADRILQAAARANVELVHLTKDGKHVRNRR